MNYQTYLVQREYIFKSKRENFFENKAVSEKITDILYKLTKNEDLTDRVIEDLKIYVYPDVASCHCKSDVYIEMAKEPIDISDCDCEEIQEYKDNFFGVDIDKKEAYDSTDNRIIYYDLTDNNIPINGVLKYLKDLVIRNLDYIDVSIINKWGVDIGCKDRVRITSIVVGEDYGIETSKEDVFEELIYEFVDNDFNPIPLCDGEEISIGIYKFKTLKGTELFLNVFDIEEL